MRMCRVFFLVVVVVVVVVVHVRRPICLLNPAVLTRISLSFFDSHCLPLLLIPRSSTFASVLDVISFSSV